MKKHLKLFGLIRLYCISLSIIWYLFGLSFRFDIITQWEEIILAQSMIEPCIEYLITSISFTLLLTYGFEYIIEKENGF